ncbi:MAG: magnesium protoporphyrin IX methyltransferase [Pseudomonadota bacterium]
MTATFEHTRLRLESYFDRTAAETWAQLTSDAPVSRIRATVRAGRDEMRQGLLRALPWDLSGRRILDAGCGVGQLSAELAARGAEVVGVDIAPNLLDVARRRVPHALQARIRFQAGDMLDPGLGDFDHVVAMDSLIHYEVADIAHALERLAVRTSGTILFTVAPRTRLLAAMHRVGKLFPRDDRSPAIQPVRERALRAALKARPGLANHHLTVRRRVARGFYISEAMELAR